MTRTKKLIAAAAIAALALGLAGCADTATAKPSRDDQAASSEASFADRTPPEVTGDAEYNNYIRAQEDVYDDPNTIIWCTASFQSANSPVFTVPIAGKLTSSSVSYYPSNTAQQYGGSLGEGRSAWLPTENQSVDGMYHGNPGPYRYGFTPGGQYVDFTNMAVFCTTSLTEFQQQTLSVAAVSEKDSVTKAAEEALRNGDTEGAQAIIDEAAK